MLDIRFFLCSVAISFAHILIYVNNSRQCEFRFLCVFSWRRRLAGGLPRGLSLDQAAKVSSANLGPARLDQAGALRGRLRAAGLWRIHAGRQSCEISPLYCAFLKNTTACSNIAAKSSQLHD